MQRENFVTIDKSAVIHKNVHFFGKCSVGAGTVIYPGSTIKNSCIGERCEIKCSFIEDSLVEDDVIVGPFAHIRQQSKIQSGCRIGNFVEVKNSCIGKKSKASHLAYIGDAEIGFGCNIGCGAIFVNYDGKQKHKTKVGDNCFIGCNCNIIAPITIASGTYICAGTTITQSTQKDDFVIGRARETIKPNYAKDRYKGE